MAPSTSAPEETRSPPRRGFETVRDMVLSLAVVGVVVAAGFLVVAWQRPEVQGPIRPDVNVTQVFTDVRASGAFPVREPTGLSADWRPTSAWYDTEDASGPIGGAVLHVGYLTPSDSYAEVRQTDGRTSEAVDEWVGDVANRERIEVEGDAWTAVTAVDGQRALVQRDLGVTTVVTGKAADLELQQLAASLR